jgi:hypothetical protein
MLNARRSNSRFGWQTCQSFTSRQRYAFTRSCAPHKVRISRTGQNIVNQISIWRPLTGPIDNYPLALCDYRSTSTSDFRATDIPSPHFNGEMYYVHQNPNHEWWYWHGMATDEILFIKCYDSAAEEAGSSIAKCISNAPSWVMTC